MGLVAPWHVGSSGTRARTRVPCIGRRILKHRASKEIRGKLDIFLSLKNFQPDDGLGHQWSIDNFSCRLKKKSYRKDFMALSSVILDSGHYGQGNDLGIDFVEEVSEHW